MLDGELVIAGEQGLDFDMLSQRIHPAASRINKLAEEMPASFVAFDLLAEGNDDLRTTPFAERRARLEAMLKNAKPPIHLTPRNDRSRRSPSDGSTASKARGSTASSPSRSTATTSKTSARWRRSSTCAPPTASSPATATHKDGKGVGSLLLGLYDDSGDLHHVGVASSFAAPKRAELEEELKPSTKDATEEPPVAGVGRARRTRRRANGCPARGNRWNAKKDMSWTPVRIELVAEVAYEHLQGDRFRHTARFQRWRPDREPSSCTYEQLESPSPGRAQRSLRRLTRVNPSPFLAR